MAAPEPKTRGWVLGRVFGARIVLHPSVLILIGLIAFLMTAGGGQSFGSALAEGLLFGGLLVASVLIHEISHALVARLFHHEVKEIVLTLIGGHTALDAKGLTPAASGVTALAGPIGSAVLGLAGLATLTLDLSPGAYTIVRGITVVNFVLAIFNALPGAPLDGGRVVEAIVWALTGKRTSGMRASAWGGRAVVLACLGYVVVSTIQAGGDPDLVFIIWSFLILSILWSAAGATLKAARILDKIEGLSVARLMRGAVGVRYDVPLRDALDLCLAADCDEVVVLSAESEPAGHFALTDARAVPEERLESTGLSAVTVPVPRGATVTMGATGQGLLETIREWWGRADVLIVVDEDEVVGVVRLADMVERLG